MNDPLRGGHGLVVPVQAPSGGGLTTVFLTRDQLLAAGSEGEIRALLKPQFTAIGQPPVEERERIITKVLETRKQLREFVDES